MNAPTVRKRRLAPAKSRPLIRIVIVGHVDHGKSTLIGRLLHETGSLPDGKLESLKAVSARRGMPFEWSFLLDALQTERDQGITIDTSQIHFRTPSRDVILIDAPGHTEFLRNMITGAAQADAAMLIVDATEGVRDQTRRHGYLLHLLGVRQVAVVVNKMDRVDFDAKIFSDLETEITGYLSGLGLQPTAVVPISARHGDGVARRTKKLDWYRGPTALEALDQFSPTKSASELTLRMPVQAVYKFDDRRILAGRVESGRITVGDQILVMPGGKRARVKSIEAWPAPDKSHEPQSAKAGQSIGITLDRELFVERGNVLCSEAIPARSARQLLARVFWLHPATLRAGARVVVRAGTAEAQGTVISIRNAIDPGRLAPVGDNVIDQNHVGEAEIALSQPLAIDPFPVNPNVGRIVMELDGRIAGGGLVLSVTDSDQSSQAQEAAPVSAPRLRSDVEGGTPANLEARARNFSRLLAGKTPAERLVYLRDAVGGKIVFTTSFGLEDQAILHLLQQQNIDVDIVTLDTGRLFPETYDLWAETERRYGRRIRAIYPRRQELEALVDRQGINGFYESREARTACCHVRKVEPLGRALSDASAWIVGLRADQSPHRGGMDVVTADTTHWLIKLSPFFDWTRSAVLDFAVANKIPVSKLHAKGFASIGCAPCTRAIRPGELERAGRWWWEEETKKECGLHIGSAP